MNDDEVRAVIRENADLRVMLRQNLEAWRSMVRLNVAMLLLWLLNFLLTFVRFVRLGE